MVYNIKPFQGLIQKMRKLCVLLVVLFCFESCHSTALFCNVTSPQTAAINNQVVICAKFIIGSTLRMYAFNTVVDKFSTISVTGIAALIKNAGAGATASVQIQFQNSMNSGSTTDANTVEMNIYNGPKNVQRSVMSIVVNLNSGGLDSIVVDNPCNNCDQCFENECYTSASGAFSEKEPTIYISWAGTDINNDELLSQSQRLSRFSLYSVSSIYSTAKNAITG